MAYVANFRLGEFMFKKIMWSIFGNDDDPTPPSWYEPSWPEWRRRFYWLAFRNPFHNLTFYVMGVAGKPFQRRSVYPKGYWPGVVFREEGGWYIAVVRYRCLRLPFVSYLGAGFIKKFYIGWRERGNLGAKLTIRS